MSARTPSQRDMLVDAETASRAQQFNIGHAAALLATFARESGAACTAGKIDNLAMQACWLRVEYLARQLQGHVAQLDRGLSGVERALDQMGRAAR